MTLLLEKIFIKPDSENRRMRYGILGGIIGITVNLLLFGIKFAIGFVSNSVAIISDAFNNLSDMGSAAVVIIGSKAASAHPDREHPFGHGRIEYISSLIISIIIILVGVELFQASIDKIVNPEKTEFSWILTSVFAATVLFKIWLYFSYKYLSSRINSTVLKATARDSLNDVISTLGVAIATVIDYFISFNADGIIGLVVAVYIIYSGYSMSKETVNLLLGTQPTPERIKELRDVIISGDEVLGVHDLMVHDYGPGRIFASAHAEVSASDDPVRVHECIDALEKKAYKDCDIRLVLHTDPISVNDERVNELRDMTLGIVKALNSHYTIHDFRITDGENNINLIFDVVADDKPTENDKKHLAEQLSRLLKAVDKRYNSVIEIDDDYGM
ncbi:MAG: cation diffusion facilitator family transporter [Ruminococcus sp.]|jgi:cation diffusion facilitator family transporter|nr:cation diffusion facilitator family transporter [Ruminococcus sp.]